MKQNPASSEQLGIVQPGPEGKALTRTIDLDLRKLDFNVMCFYIGNLVYVMQSGP